jgi:DNA-3-methyladenine glycosylase II/AraC family transcriptional regulator of adaptative response / DNA-3-methyladenine glycosylase II
MVEASREVASGRVDLAEHDRAWTRLLRIRNIGSWTVEKLAFHGQGRDDMLPAGDLAYVKLVGRMLRMGRRATVEEVREFFAPYAPYEGLAGLYLLRARRFVMPPGPPV